MLPQLIEDANVAQINSTYTRAEMIGQMQGMKLAITYLALYIGLVMLLAVAAILAIQLLSLTIDSLKRYRMLSKIGCDTRMLSRSLFAQITIYFLLPLLVGVCHSAWTISILSETLFKAFGVNLLPTILMSAGLVVVIYGGYLLITYFVSRSMVVQGVRQQQCSRKLWKLGRLWGFPATSSLAQESLRARDAMKGFPRLANSKRPRLDGCGRFVLSYRSVASFADYAAPWRSDKVRRVTVGCQLFGSRASLV